jgi:hypothetical protein
MGQPTEFNWYIVTSDIIKISDRTYTCTKSDTRLYPMNCPLPVIVKGVGCIMMGRVIEIVMSKKGTTCIKFQEDKYEYTDEVLKHYYTMYNNMQAEAYMESLLYDE